MLNDHLSTNPNNPQLVVVFLRGAADALNLVAPYGEQAYYTLRPSLGISRPDALPSSIGKSLIDLDGFFGLHPSLEPLLPAWNEGNLAIVHACGSPDESRSHFRAMELMERGVEETDGPASGWIGRHLGTHKNGNNSPFRAIGIGELTQRSLRGGIPVTVLRSISDYQYKGDSPASQQLREALAILYAGQEPISKIGSETLVLLEELQKLDPENYHPSGNASYPDNKFGDGLKQIAMLIKAGLGLEICAVDLDGWDTHFAQGSSTGLFSNLARTLAEGLGAFHADISAFSNSVITVVMTEFGRRAHENGSLGTDHGHGALMMLLGGKINGGQVWADWPGLDKNQLIGPGDLAITTDYRDVLSEICATHLGNTATDLIFPGYTPKRLGIIG